LRSHTRPDFTRADRVHAGLRDLRSLYVRANTCVACHQTVELPLLQAGHPELLFEMDGQCASQPRHWRTERDAPGPQAWLLGQAAALREASWQLTREKTADVKLLDRWRALVWLLERAASAPGLPASPIFSAESDPEDFARTRKAADDYARRVAGTAWSDALTRSLLTRLVGAAGDFRDNAVTPARHARRAERLALALDRLGKALPPERFSAAASADVDELFKLAQSVPDFDPAAWARTLERLAGKLSPAGR
jgi:hypothetical protein